jgi:Lar family restriction alleviation protein
MARSGERLPCIENPEIPMTLERAPTLEYAEIILPCPFCGSPKTSVATAGGDFAVVCETCGGIGPEDNFQDSAVQRWNSRSALAASFRAEAR